MNFHTVPRLLQALLPQATWHMPPGHADEKRVYLTFDDGPIYGPTEFVLEALDKYQVPATFFCVGDNVEKHPALFQQVLEAGHSVGNHTFHHIKGWRSSLPQYVENTARASHAMQAVAGRATLQLGDKPLFRPPYGQITFSQARALADQYQIVMWTTLSADYDVNLGPGKCLIETYRATRPGAIIVFHDNVKAMPRVERMLMPYIHVLQQEGYTFHRM